MPETDPELRRVLAAARREPSLAARRALLTQYAEAEIGEQFANHAAAERAVMIEARAADLLVLVTDR